MLQMNITVSIEISKYFYEEYAKEPLLKQFLTFADLKIFYAIQTIDLRFQIDLINPEEIQLVEKYRGEPDNARPNARLFTILISHSELKMVSTQLKSPQLTFY